MMNSFARTVLLMTVIIATSAPFAQTSVSAALQIPLLDWQQRSDWVNVKRDVAPAAVGDGVADDTAAIQKALSAVHNGSTVYLPAGTYRITQTLNVVGELTGFRLVGDGRGTTLVWDGEAGGKMLRVDGVAYSTYEGISFDGRGKAAIGLWHDCYHRFETEVRNKNLAFRGFTDAGILSNPTDKIATAEITFENCLFEDCRRGVAFLKFNDYDFTFTGCEFDRCDTGIECLHGNFYARDCHFEGSRIEDIHAAQEHGSSVRRCTSVGSNSFLRHESPVGSLTVQDCWVDSWKTSDGAIKLGGAPVVMFDCRFTHPPAGASGAAVRVTNGSQRLFLSENHADGALVQGNDPVYTYNIPAGQRNGSITSATQTFLQSSARIPRKVFDAKADFGAKGDGKTDDAAAIQQTVDAARAAGKDAIAYLPTGNYAITKTIHVTGANYFVGGSGTWSRLIWHGPEGGTILDIREPEDITVENIEIGHGDAGVMTDGLDIDQIGTGKPSRVTYDGVWVYGLYTRQPFRQGIRFRDLGATDTVIVRQMQGNMHFVNCANATILANTTYEGSVVVDGKERKRDGFLGFQTRLATLVKHGLYLRDSNSIVMSDFYIEQANSGFYLEGNDGDPAGRATIQGAKLNAGGHPDETANFRVFDVHNYHGQAFLGHQQFYIEPTMMPIYQTGTQPFDLFVFACNFYDSQPDMHTDPAAHVYFEGNEPFRMQAVHYSAPDVGDAKALPQLSAALDDLRKLGWMDLHFNFGENPRDK